MLIEVEIPEVGFERIRDKIASILIAEFQNQVNEFNNTNCKDVNFFAERLTAMDKVEADFINISLFKGDYSNKDVAYVDGTYQYTIDIVTGAKNTATDAGDKLANFRLQKLMGIVRYILEHPNYATLEFDRPFILHTELSKFQVYKTEKGIDAMNNAVGQMIFTVRCGEETTPNDGNVIQNNDTVVKLELTELGYQYKFEVLA